MFKFENLNKMHTISDFEQLSGIHTHTNRMLERRYKALIPHRSVGNTRYYDDGEQLRLLNIVNTKRTKLKIAIICTSSPQNIQAVLDQQNCQTVLVNQKIVFYFTQLLNFAKGYKEQEFSDLLTSCITNYGLKYTYVNIIHPLLVRLGLMWRKDSICAVQEHFSINIVRQKIAVATDSLPIAKTKAAAWLLFLPEKEEQEIGLLFANYLLRQANIKVIYLGANVPLSSIKQAVSKNNITHMLLFMMQQRLSSKAQEYINILADNFKSKHIELAGNKELIETLQLPSNVKKIQTVDDFERMIKKSNDK